jgi:hypothetical protein
LPQGRSSESGGQLAALRLEVVSLEAQLAAAVSARDKLAADMVGVERDRATLALDVQQGVCVVRDWCAKRWSVCIVAVLRYSACPAAFVLQ